MKFSDIKVGHWYETRVGVGRCVEAIKRHPPAVKFLIVAPFPRDEVFINPRDVMDRLIEASLPPEAAGRRVVRRRQLAWELVALVLALFVVAMATGGWS